MLRCAFGSLVEVSGAGIAGGSHPGATVAKGRTSGAERVFQSGAG